MTVKSYRARSLRQALVMVRRDLGPNAAVLDARYLSGGLLAKLTRGSVVEVTAADSGLTATETDSNDAVGQAERAVMVPRADAQDYRDRLKTNVQHDSSDTHSLVDRICRESADRMRREVSESHFRLLTNLLDAEIPESTARNLVSLVADDSNSSLRDVDQLTRQLVSKLEDEIQTSGPVHISAGQRRIVAMVGPTGVGKTTSIAKLAGNLRLVDKRRVGLITVDTYRVAAVDQLRTYADIIDVPMEIVSTPCQMSEAVFRMSDRDVVFLDTAGRSPTDAIQLQELKALLSAARCDEVHLVLSAVSSSHHLVRTVRTFTNVGLTSLLITKLDETTTCGNLIDVLRSAALPVSYLTNGQCVPDDIIVANKTSLVQAMLGMNQLADEHTGSGVFFCRHCSHGKPIR